MKKNIRKNRKVKMNTDLRKACVCVCVFSYASKYNYVQPIRIQISHMKSTRSRLIFPAVKVKGVRLGV